MTTHDTEGRILSADLVPYISRPEVDMVTARVLGADLTPEVADGLDQEAGTVALRVLAVIHGAALRDGLEIQVPMIRAVDPGVRDRNTRNQWNNLDLVAGRVLLLACRGTPGSNRCQGLGAVPLESPSNPTLAAIRSAYAIEGYQGPPSQRLAMIADALASPQAQLRFYALDLLGRRALLGREQGAELIARSIRSGAASPDDRLDLGDALTRIYFFQPDRKADDTNRAIVAALAGAMVAESDPSRRMAWVRLLSGSIQGELSARPAEDRAIRHALVQSVRSPSPGQVMQALDTIQGHVDPGEQTLIAGLKRVWREAGAH